MSIPKKIAISLTAALLTSTAGMARPLKVYILAGQSNMEGHATVSTFDHVGMDPKTAPILKEMRNADGSPRVCDDVYISYLTTTGSWGKTPKPVQKQGKLTTGFGSQSRGPKIGPEFTFGIYMHKQLNEPFLIIKTAWGGKSLHTDFRSPSGGEYKWDEKAAATLDDENKEAKKKATGAYYKLMIEHVKSVLTDPKKAHPSYNKKDGYELAGFVWFQGFNDMVDRGTYPKRNHSGGYDLYSELMAHFIRDVRKELNAPKLPFVIGVMGIDGPSTDATEAAKPPRYRGITPNFRNAMAAPASMPEFKGTVAAVCTAKYWDIELDELSMRSWKKVDPKQKEEVKKRGEMSKEERKALRTQIVNEFYTPRELEILKKGRSNKGYHYLGSSKIIGQIGKAFADAMVELQSNQK
jgi:hypothetical protein